MKGQFFRNVCSLLLGLLTTWPAVAATNWTQPTPEELNMTSDPKAPGAPAVYLYREEITDDTGGTQSVYARIKILTHEGVEKYSDVVVPYDLAVDWSIDLNYAEKVKGIEARTIHGDGTIIPFSGKPWTKELVKAGGFRSMEKGFSMPDVQVGSIIEYRWKRHYQFSSLPKWYIQQPIFVHRAHYSLTHTGYAVDYIATLPPDVKIISGSHQGADLTIDDVPALPDEDDSPPRLALGYRVLFYYPHGDADTWWQIQGMNWGRSVDKFCAPARLTTVASQIVASTDTAEQKARKIYEAVMKFENTDFTREHTQAENKAENLRVRTATDIWKAQRGDGDDLALLFVALARAAGIKAWAMAVTDRDRDVFLKARQDWDQLDDVIAIVNIDGKELYVDPGQRYCEFGKLHWKHTWTSGVRQLDGGGAEIVTTPFPVYSETTTIRNADLTLTPDGNVNGTISVLMTGSAALFWRQRALLTDEDATNKEFRDNLQEGISPTVTLKMVGLDGLRDATKVLTAKLEASGSIGTKTGHRLISPATFFEAHPNVLFASANRQDPVYLPYSYTVQDHVEITLLEGMTVESSPIDASLSIAPNADFTVKYRSDGAVYKYARQERVANILYEPKDYPGLRNFFQKVNAQDQQQVVIKLTTSEAAPSTHPSSGSNE